MMHEKLLIIIDYVVAIKENQYDLQQLPVQAIKKSIEDMVGQCLQYGKAQDEVDRIQYAVVVMFDEFICRYCVHSKNEWSKQSLQLYYYHSNTAGDQFFQHLNHALQAKQLQIDLLEVYYICLSMGFAGKHYSHQQCIDEYKTTIQQHLQNDSTSNYDSLTKNTFCLWHVLIMMMIVFLVSYLFTMLVINQQYKRQSNAIFENMQAHQQTVTYDR